MTVGIDRRYEELAVELFKNIEDARIKETELGQVRFRGLGFDTYAGLLFSILTFSDEVPEVEAREMVTDALLLVGRQGEISRQSFLREVNLVENRYLSSPVLRFVLAGSLSIGRITNLPRLRINGNELIFESMLPTRFQNEAARIVDRPRMKFRWGERRAYLSVRVHVSARGIHEAAAVAFDTLDLVRGTWNWTLNFEQRRMIFGGGDIPVNRIVFGPVQTLHYADGRLATDSTYWYQPEYNGLVMPYDLSADIDKIYSSWRYVSRRLNRHPYRGKLKDAIIQYGRALDEPRADVSFIKLWSVFETLTATEPNNYDKAIRRAAFIYKDPIYHKGLLNRLKDYRNALVHKDERTVESDSFLQHLKAYVERLLHFHLVNPARFSSLEEAAIVLALPPDLNDLFLKRRHLDQAIKLLDF